MSNNSFSNSYKFPSSTPRTAVRSSSARAEPRVLIKLTRFALRMFVCLFVCKVRFHINYGIDFYFFISHYLQLLYQKTTNY